MPPILPPGIDNGNHDDIDVREALFNDAAIGSISYVQASKERITQLRGILFDLDPKLYRTGPISPHVPSDPREFFDLIAQNWLARHPLLQQAQVRISGIGLHAIINLDPPVVFCSDGERDRWAGVVETVQAALPVDPDQPGMTAVTRPVGSINSKNGASVELLREGTSVTADDVLSLFTEMCKTPFRTVMTILTGTNRLTPCPICQGEATTLSALDYSGQCYGGCGKIKLQQLYDLVLQPRDRKHEEGRR
ncbi:MAG: hypothetical protein GXY83_19965 [Rhodopirellula sp.]|nr:hypothetical protein [Rhodopirellula sp.]